MSAEKRNLTELVGVRLTKDELEAARIVAARANVTVPTWLRRQLLDTVYHVGPPFHFKTDAEAVAAFLQAHGAKP